MRSLVISSQSKGQVVARADIGPDGKVAWTSSQLSPQEQATLEAAIVKDLADGFSGGRLTGGLEWFELMAGGES